MHLQHPHPLQAVDVAVEVFGATPTLLASSLNVRPPSSLIKALIIFQGILS